MFIKIDENGYLLDHISQETEGYPIEIADQNIVIWIGREWTYKYKYVEDTLVELPQEEIDNQPHQIENFARAARQHRDKLLAESDFVVTTDSSASTECKAAFVTYRQNLRDISEQENFPTEINWPVTPAYVKA